MTIADSYADPVFFNADLREMERPRPTPKELLEEIELLAKELGDTTKPADGRDPWVSYLTRLQLAASVFNTVCYRVEDRAKATRIERRLVEIR